MFLHDFNQMRIQTQSNTSDVTFYENSEWLKAAVFLQKVPS